MVVLIRCLNVNVQPQVPLNTIGYIHFVGDEISGISVSVRERDDIVTIWNTQSQLAEQCNILEKVKELVPEVSFTASFYKGEKVSMSTF